MSLTFKYRAWAGLAIVAAVLIGLTIRLNLDLWAARHGLLVTTGYVAPAHPLVPAKTAQEAI